MVMKAFDLSLTPKKVNMYLYTYYIFFENDYKYIFVLNTVS